MIYIKLPDTYPYALDRLRSDFPNTSFAQPYVADDLAEFGVFPVSETSRPEYDAFTHRVEEVAPVEIDGAWTQQWQLVLLSDEEQAAVRETEIRNAIVRIEAALDAHLDSVAQQYRFADRTRIALRAAYPNVWHALGLAFGTWMDTCNAMAAQGMQDFLDGKIPLQTPEEVIAKLPEFVAP